MRNLSALLVCLVASAVFYRAQKPPALEKPVLDSPWGTWGTYQAPDGSFEVKLPGSPSWVTERLSDESEDHLHQAVCHKPGGGVKVGWKNNLLAGEFRSCKVLEERSFSTSGLTGVEWELQGDAHWSPRLDGIGIDDYFDHHRLLLIHAGKRTYFALLSGRDATDLKNDFPKLRDSFRIQDR